MKIRDYLTAKYRSPIGNWSISDDEARVLGIPVPLLRGWTNLYSDDEISVAQAGQLMALMARQLREARGDRRRRNAQWATEFLRLHYGDSLTVTVLPLRTKKARKLEPARKARQERHKEYTAQVHAYVNNDSFLASYEWRKLRMEALKKYGARCQCCGAKPEDGVRIHVDHIKPRRKFPMLALSMDNLQVLCEVCNHGKGNWDETDWRERKGMHQVMEHAASALLEVLELEEQHKAHLKDMIH